MVDPTRATNIWTDTHTLSETYLHFSAFSSLFTVSGMSMDVRIYSSISITHHTLLLALAVVVQEL